jgi:glycosyltransferase involved in cell wall biosynthesis
MTIAWIFRKPQPQYFSIERVFNLIENQLTGSIVSIERTYMPQHQLSPGNLYQNFRATKKVKADLFHVTGDVHYTVLALPAKKTILTIHDCVFMYQMSGLKRLLLYYLFLKWPVKKSAVITTISEKSKQDIINFTNCSPNKVVVIPDPLDERFSHQPYTFNKDCPIILFVGITPNKNLFRVIKALEGIQCLLHILGKIPQPEREQLERSKISYKESYKLSDEELVQAYVNADIVLFPSLFEGFGLPIIEAQQTGRPVITSNIEPMKEVAGDAACLIDPLTVESIREGVIKVINEDVYREELIKKGLHNVQRYNPEWISNEYLLLYKRLQISINESRQN